MANTKVTTRVIADDAITSDKLASGLTLGGDTTLSGHLDLADSKNIRLGASDDLQLYHDASNSYIQHGNTGNFNITTANGSEFAFVAQNNGSVFLYHDGTAKLQTQSTGVSISGTATATTFSGALSGSIASATTATTQSASDNSTKVATTAYVDGAISDLVDSSPSALNTLNELAAALGDDANFSTTVTNSIATKMPLAGGTFTGNVNITKETPYLNLTDSSASRTLGVFVDDNNSVLRASGQMLLQIGSQSAITIDTSRNSTFAANVTVPYLATTSYIDLNNSGNRGKIGWSGNHTYIATTSSVGSIIFKNNVGSTDAPQTGGDTLLTLADGGNATFAGNIIGSDVKAAGSGGLSLQTDEGTKRLFINDNGNVAIGTASLANAQLHVAADTGNSVTAVMRLRGSNSTARVTRLQFEDYSGAIADGLIDFVIPTAGSTTGAYLGLGFNASTQLKLTNGSSEFSGNLGIGGTPTNLLQVFGGSGDSRIQFTNNNSGNAYSDGFWVGMDNTQAYLLQRENQPISFFTNATKKHVMNGDGAVGINCVATAGHSFEAQDKSDGYSMLWTGRTSSGEGRGVTTAYGLLGVNSTQYDGDGATYPTAGFGAAADNASHESVDFWFATTTSEWQPMVFMCIGAHTSGGQTGQTAGWALIRATHYNNGVSFNIMDSGGGGTWTTSVQGSYGDDRTDTSRARITYSSSQNRTVLSVWGANYGGFFGATRA